MEYTLMHKNIPVVDMRILGNGYIEELRDTLDIRHLPLGITISNAGIDHEALNEWWESRSIPASRDGIRETMQRIGIASPSRLIEKCLGLSLSDHYWICPKGSGIAWEDINFFQNEFSKDMGEALFGSYPAYPDKINFMSPDNTSDGWLRKKWIIADGKRLLMKGGSGAWKQEPLNEVIASRICKRLGIPHVTYTLTFDGGNPYSLCENFVTTETELVPAWRLFQTKQRRIETSLFDHLLDCCESLCIPGARAALNMLLTLDYIISNEDRHWNNFGIIRDVNTLEPLGFSPIYDSGSSLWYATDTQRIGEELSCKPFRNDQREQIKLVDDYSWFEHQALDGLSNEIMEVLSQSDDIDNNRAVAITGAVMERCRHIGQKV